MKTGAEAQKILYSEAGLVEVDEGEGENGKINANT
jgi:hypothetical protein